MNTKNKTEKPSHTPGPWKAQEAGPDIQIEGRLVVDTDKLRGHVLAAKNIKRELAKSWPAVVFSVRSKSYSGGNRISVYWTDGPTAKQVDAILNKYEGGSFDGMTDSYTHSRTPWTEVFGSSKYIHGSRTTTKAMVLKALASKGFAGDDRIRIEEYGDSAAVRSGDRGLEHWANDAVSNYDATTES